jgi:hypothetical protein
MNKKSPLNQQNHHLLHVYGSNSLSRSEQSENLVQEIIMTSIIRSVLGAALVLTGASAAMAQSANPPAASQTGASTASNNAAVAQTPQAGASTAASAGQATQPRRSDVADTTKTYGGYDPNSTEGTRAFWESRNQY